MSRDQASRSNLRKKNDQLLAMALIGAGLVLFGVVVLVIVSGSGAAQSAKQVSAVPFQVNFPAPELNLSDLNGLPVSLADSLGQVVLINNWATWCPPCKAEMPTLQAYFDAHRAKGFTLLAIEAGEPLEIVAEFVRQYGLTFPVWLDLNQEALRVFRNDGLPNSYVVDRSGTVRLAWNGAISREMLEKYVTPLLED